MRKTKRLILALLAMTGLTTAWASDLPGSKPDSNAAKSSYAVTWTGTTDVVYNAQPHAIIATYFDGSATITLDLTYSNGVEVRNTAPVNAGAWTVTATAPAGITLTNATAMLNIQKAPVYVTGAAAAVAKFDDGSPAGTVTNNGILNGVYGTDQVGHVTTAIFEHYTPGVLSTNDTINLYYALAGDDPEMLGNYVIVPSVQLYTPNGAVIPNIVPGSSSYPNGIHIDSYGYCNGSSYGIDYYLAPGGNPDQYRIDFADARFTDIGWTNVSAPSISSATGTINVTFPDVDVPTGNYDMNIYFRDSRYPGLESQPFAATFHINLPASYTQPLFDDVIALVDTCNCFSEIQWYHNGVAIPGANGFFYREEGGLTGDYFVVAKMNGVWTTTCPQNDVTTLINDNSQGITVNAYPNPTTESVNVTIEGAEQFSHTLSVISTVGVEMMRGTFEGNSATIDMQNYQNGSYMVNVDGIVVRVIKK
jgi:hypothetical protein